MIPAFNEIGSQQTQPTVKLKEKIQRLELTNDGKYDNIDRSDEDIIQLVDGGVSKINTPGRRMAPEDTETARTLSRWPSLQPPISNMSNTPVGHFGKLDV